MSKKSLAKVFGWVFIAIGVLGFVPALTPDGNLLGIFHVDTIHNIVHILSGIAALLMSTTEDKAKTYFKIFGVVYALVTVIGFLDGDSILGIFTINGADNILHLAIAAVALWAGFSRENTMVRTV